MRKSFFLAGVFALLATFISFGATQRIASAVPAEGTLIRDLVIPNSSGVGVGFDGTNLYWMDFGGATLHKITTAGAFVADIPIVGCTATVISWDATRSVFWGASGTQISKITTGGVCAPWFDVAADLPGACDNGFGCSSLIDGVNYDPSDDSIWYSPDASQRVYHFDIGGVGAVIPLGFFDVNDVPNDVFPECGFNYNSGVAVGVGPIMYLAADGCGAIFKYSRAGLKLGFFAIPGARHEDMECDNVTFKSQGVDGIWVKDAFDDHIRAFAVEKQTCVIVDDQPPVVACTETTNPAGKTVPPAGSTTLPGPKGGQNEDGFYLLSAKDVAPVPLTPDPNPKIYVADSGSTFVSGPYANGDKVKITQAPGATPNDKPMAGVIAAHITLKGDALVYAVDASGNVSAKVSCKVPPPPK
jgi:hypothetical protein